MENITINKEIGLGDAGLPFQLTIDVEYEKQYNAILITEWMEHESPYDNPGKVWYERVEEVIEDYFYSLNPNYNVHFCKNN